MTKDELLKLCRDEAKRRHPGADAVSYVEKAPDKTARATWLAGCNSSGWVATVDAHMPKRVVAHCEAWGPTPGRAAAALADAMGVAWREETTEAKR